MRYMTGRRVWDVFMLASNTIEDYYEDNTFYRMITKKVELPYPYLDFITNGLHNILRKSLKEIYYGKFKAEDS